VFDRFQNANFHCFVPAVICFLQKPSLACITSPPSFLARISLLSHCMTCQRRASLCLLVSETLRFPSCPPDEDRPLDKDRFRHCTVHHIASYKLQRTFASRLMFMNAILFFEEQGKDMFFDWSELRSPLCVSQAAIMMPRKEC